MSENILDIKGKGVKRVYLWLAVTLYTLLLPHVIVIYRTIVRNYSSKLAGRVPIFVLIFMGLIFLLISVRKKCWVKTIITTILSLVIVCSIIKLEPNPNKHIHIIEYILMAWLLFYLFSLDYKGGGIFILIFICASMLGIVDELQQGLHPARYYGLSDMFINTSSAFVGILSIIGLGKEDNSVSYGWFKDFSKSLLLPLIILFNFAGAVISLAYLFKVQSEGIFTGIYPIWVIGWDVLAILSSLPYIFSYGRGIIKNGEGDVTYMLWVFYPLIIMLVMHLVPLIAFTFGINFK
ncbi:MAG: VanZ family protein [Nitrospinae bacterium]|nr:VanZ family protein [Nitrospinota bacterium]